jgi:hypothetical protein
VCSDQQFVAADQVLGPMHTNDRFRICNDPYFGQTANDRIEASDPNEFENTCNPGSPPGGAGTFIANAAPLDFPPSNTQLADDTLIGWTFTGKTILHFNSPGNTVDITNANFNGGRLTTQALPPNYVIYVKNSSSCTTNYTEAQHYNNPPGCGDAWVSGNYQKSVTVGADNDIIINGNIQRQDPQAEMGLIANGFIRVYHPVNWNGDTECSQGDTTDAPGTLINPVIDAAILTLRHSFLVDNPGCGQSSEGTLTVDGAIAQWYRGTVGLNSNGVITHGYAKGYTYDQNLRYADPPYFLDPVETSWDVVRETEQVPALAP